MASLAAPRIPCMYCGTSTNVSSMFHVPGPPPAHHHAQRQAGNLAAAAKRHRHERQRSAGTSLLGGTGGTDKHALYQTAGNLTSVVHGSFLASFQGQTPLSTPQLAEEHFFSCARPCVGHRAGWCRAAEGSGGKASCTDSYACRHRGGPLQSLTFLSLIVGAAW